MIGTPDDSYILKDRLYIPVDSVPAAAGIFLPFRLNLVEEHLECPLETDRRLLHLAARSELGAARVSGDSMINAGIFDGDVVVYRRVDPRDLRVSGLAVIEKVGEEERFGSLALKRIVFRKTRTYSVNEYDDEIDWNEPEIVLRSYNLQFPERALDSSGDYRLQRVVLRRVRRDDVRLMYSEMIRDLAAGEE